MMRRAIHLFRRKKHSSLSNDLIQRNTLYTIASPRYNYICRNIDIVNNNNTCKNNNTKNIFVHFSSSISSTTKTTPGLFGIPNLHEISDWKSITDQVIDDCNNARQRIYSKINNPDLSILDDLDYLSYTICEIADAAELCRCVHVDFEHRRAAEETVFRFADYMLSLGHDENMYKVLCKLMENVEMYQSMSAEQLTMANDMKNEFERDGVHLDESIRERLREINNDITSLEADFQKMAQQVGGSFAVPAETIEILPKELYAQATNEKLLQGYGLKKGAAILHSNWVDIVTNIVPNPAVRESFYKFSKSLGDENVQILEKLIVKKNEKAQLLGFESYGDLIAKEQMLGSREHIKQFLVGILENTKSKMNEELNIMKTYKQVMEKNVTGSDNIDDDIVINSWDVPFYSSLATREKFQTNFNGYFKLENVLKGLEFVCLRIFNLKIKSERVSEAEDWTNGQLNKNNHVRKLILYDGDKSEEGSQNIVGTIYLDLYPRANKVGGATHFAIRHSHRKLDGEYQLPTVFLNTNFAHPTAPKSNDNTIMNTLFQGKEEEISLLKHEDIQTLFHEFGHALHTLLSRTRYQHLAGTRVKTDFVEIPSHLMEYFVRDYRVLKYFIDEDNIEEDANSNDYTIPTKENIDELNQSRSYFSATNIHSQVLWAMFDQAIHGARDNLETVDSTKIYEEITNTYMCYPYAEGTKPHAKFTHFINYGSTYYSYLHAKVYSAMIWRKLFLDDPLSNKGGETFRKEILYYGGGKCPYKILETVLEEDARDIKALTDSFIQHQ